MSQVIAEVLARVAELERRLNGMARHGTVAQVDAAQGLARIKLGEATGGGEFLSPWVPYSQMAGAMKAHVPPAVGQQMTIIAPGGEWRQAVAVPMTWSDANPSPSGAADENVVTYGDVTITIKADGLRIEVGGVSLVVDASGVRVTGGRVEHDGLNIGSTHRHGGVDTGNGNTAPPLA